MRKMNFSNHVINVFAEMETNYDEVKNLMYDLAVGNDIYDEDRLVSKSEAEDKLRSIT